MNHGSLFSGVGGFDLAAHWMGWNNVFHCEINPFCQQVLNYYWPNAKSYTDIKKTDFTGHRGFIDVVSGGFPCQPYSHAGKRKGTGDDRHLWPEMLRAIREIQPGWVVGENVRGLTDWDGGVVFDQVQADLEAEGYEVIPFLLPACSVGAPHRRDRIWIVGYSEHNGLSSAKIRGNEQESSQQAGQEKVGQPTGADRLQSGFTANADETAGRGMGTKTRDRKEFEGGNRIATDTKQSGRRAPSKTGLDQPRQLFQDSGREENTNGVVDHGPGKSSTDAGDPGLQGWELNGSFDQERQDRREQPSGPAAQLCKIGDWQHFPTQSPLCSRNDGLPTRLAGITVPKHRNESIKAYGNAIVPQVVLQIFKAIAQYESTTTHQKQSAAPPAA